MPMTPAEARALALALPGASEAPHFQRLAFRARGRIFATLNPHGHDLNLMLTPEMQADVLASFPGVTYAVAGGWGRQGATTVALDQAAPGQVEALLRRAWARRAGPKA